MSFLLSRLGSRFSSSLLPRLTSLSTPSSLVGVGSVRSVVYIAENDAELRDLIKNNQKKLVVVDWFANWCGP
jgi:thiol:disulfide interchange protein